MIKTEKGNGIRRPTFTEVLSVTQITAVIKDILVSTFQEVSIEGEISNFRPASSGHWYFTLKDHNAAISAVMFRGHQGRLSFRPKDGQKVIAKGSISLYEKRGTYQIVCTSLRLAGEGDILAMLEQRKRKLANEGLFDQDRKKQIPKLPKNVLVITSPTGAAIRDILQVIDRRNSNIRIRILPAAVQGEKAVNQLCSMIKLANRKRLGDVIILGRGGGSIEDLLPFSEEAVVRAIADSDIPVISAVGHEIDWALSDYAADLRAPTPSAAAELVTAHIDEILQKITMFKDYAAQTVHGKITKADLLLRQFSSESLMNTFQRYIEPRYLRLDDLRDSLIKFMQDKAVAKKHALLLAKSSLEGSSPIAILQRGYAVVTEKKSGTLIIDSRNLNAGDRIIATLASGSLQAVIEETVDE